MNYLRDQDPLKSIEGISKEFITSDNNETCSIVPQLNSDQINAIRVKYEKVLQYNFEETMIDLFKKE